MNRIKDNKRLWIAAAAILLILIVLAILFIHRKPNSAVNTPDAETPSGIVWDENAEKGGIVPRSAEEVQKELNRKVEEGMINISMNTSPSFPDGLSEGNLLIVNSERNNYPQVVTIERKDTGEEIYRSGAIPVGSKIEQAKLSVPLDAGKYECVAYFNNVDPKTGSVLGTAGAEIVVTIQN